MLVTKEEYFSTVFLVDLRAYTESMAVYDMCSILLKDHEEYYNKKYSGLTVNIQNNRPCAAKIGVITSCSLSSYFVFCIDTGNKFQEVKSPKRLDKIND